MTVIGNQQRVYGTLYKDINISSICCNYIKVTDPTIKPQLGKLIRIVKDKVVCYTAIISSYNEDTKWIGLSEITPVIEPYITKSLNNIITSMVSTNFTGYTDTYWIRTSFQSPVTIIGEFPVVYVYMDITWNLSYDADDKWMQWGGIWGWYGYSTYLIPVDATLCTGFPGGHTVQAHGFSGTVTNIQANSIISPTDIPLYGAMSLDDRSSGGTFVRMNFSAEIIFKNCIGEPLPERCIYIDGDLASYVIQYN